MQGNLRRDETNRATSRDLYAQVETPLSSACQLVGGVRSGEVTMDVSDHYIVPPNSDDSGSLKYSYTNPMVGVRWRAAPQHDAAAKAARRLQSTSRARKVNLRHKTVANYRALIRHKLGASTGIELLRAAQRLELTPP